MNAVFGPAFDEQWRQRFERFAQHHTNEAHVSGWSDTGLTRRVAIFTQVLDSLGLSSGQSVLDLGCGAGTYSRLLAGRGHRVIGLDYSLPSLARARQYDPDGACHYTAADAYALPFAAFSFDLVVCIGVLQAVATPQGVLAEMARVLRPAGFLVVEALNGRAFAARAGRAQAAVRRLPPRVRSYDPRQVEQWLAERTLQRLSRATIVLPPRTLPGLSRLLDRPIATRVLTRAPLRDAVAHSFFFVARKSGDLRRSHSSRES